MQPSSGDTPTKSGNPWRRYGPLIAIVAVIAVIAGILIFASSGDDDDGNAAATTAAASAGTTAAGSGSSVAAGTTAAGGESAAAARGAITFNEAKAAGRTDLTFADSCDTEHGTAEDPRLLRAECYANVADNGGATANGVTADSITVVVYIAPDTDPGARLHHRGDQQRRHRRAGQADVPGLHRHDERALPDLRAQGRAEVPRRVGHSDNATAARADAVKAVEEMGAFAVWGGPVARARVDRGDQGPRRHLPRVPGDPRSRAGRVPDHRERRADPAAARRVRHEEAERQATPSSPATTAHADAAAGLRSDLHRDRRRSARRRTPRTSSSSSPRAASTCRSRSRTRSTRRPCRSRPPASSRS